jgi:hypothetical protein
MTLRLSDTARNHILESLEISCNGQTLAAGTGSGGSVSGTAAQPKLQIWSGSSPATCAAAATGTKLAEMTLPADFYSAAASGSKALANGPWSTTGLANGVAGYYRVVNNAGTTCHEQGDIGSEMTLDNTNIASGQQVQITAKTLTAPNP